MLIFHHNDSDGRCAAAVMGRWAKEGKYVPIYIEMDYKDKPNVELIEKDDGVAIVDFIFKPDVMIEVCRKTANIIWCDHHQTAKDYGYDELSGHRDFSLIKGLSGCECTWKYCYPHREIPEALKLLGDYDAWRLEHKPECFEFYEGLKLEDTSPDGKLWDELYGCFKECTGYYAGIEIKRIIDQGKAAIKYRDNYCEEMRESFGYETEIDGHKAYAMNAYRFGSKGFGDKIKEYDVCIAYAHDGKRFTVSLYSETVDVSVIAKKFGGGGHKGAAGFVCDELPFKRA
jgi:oligoribonuclease NrnB/cAMP/cGMP phosphodiesterase (DHH superfamily)